MLSRAQTVKADAIQGLRAIAALLVVVDHSISVLIDKGIINRDMLKFALLCGGLGVKIFFLISGFIMTVTTFDRFGSRDAPALFLSKRLSRIVPLYWLATTLYALRLAVQGRPTAISSLALSLGFIPWPNERGVLQPVYGLGWTLNYEMFFYALFAASLVFRAYRGLAIVVCSLLVLVSVVGVGLQDYLGSPLGAILGYWGNTIVLFFAGGIVLGLLKVQLFRDNGWKASVGIAFAVGCLGAYLGADGVGIIADPKPIGMACVCWIAVAFCALASSDKSRNGELTLYVLGDASYSIYLVHGFLVGPGIYLWMKLTNASSGLTFIALMLVASSIAGIFSYRFVEQPMLRSIRRWTGQAGSTPARWPRSGERRGSNA